MVVVVLVSSAVVAMANCGGCPGDKAPGCAKETTCDKDAEQSCTSLYACATCKTVAQEAGKCGKCKADLAKMSVLSCKNGTAKLCACAAACKCTCKTDDATQCSCGKDVVAVSVKGLKCGSACKAPTAKDK
jgi:hypothetical protein